MKKRTNPFFKNYQLLWGCIVYMQLAVNAWAASMTDGYADDENRITPYASLSESYDSNVLKLPSVQNAESIGAGSSLSDTWHTLEAGMSIDEYYSEQHITADANIAKVNFERLYELDHYDKNAKFNWNWYTKNNISGNIGISYQQNLAPYTDFHLLEKNMRTQESEYADMSWLFNPSWRLRAGFTNYHLDYDLLSQQPENRTEERMELGLDYVASTGSSVGIQLRHISAYFPIPQEAGGSTIENDYTQDEIKAKIDWIFSALTQFHFLGGWVDRQYGAYTSRDFSGLNTRFSADWSPTRLLTFNTAVWREIESVDDLTAAYSINHGISAQAKWNASEFLQAEMRYQYERQDFSQSAQVTTVPFLNDALRSASLVLTYKPSQRLQLQATLIRLLQHQNDPDSGFSSNSATLECRYEF